MPLETATYINQLVSTNPAATDTEAQGDDHLRLIKSCVQATFPNFTAAPLNSTQAAIDTAVGVTQGTNAGLMKAGTAAAPGLAVAGDATTGLYASAAGHLDVSISGAQALDISATGISTPGSVSATGGVSATGAFSGGTGQLVPTGGTIVWWTDTLPTGFIWANGAAVSRTTYASLFALLGTNFGAGDGSTTFNLPDLREVAPYGKSTMGATTSPGRITNYVLTTLGGFIGECLHLLGVTEMPSHTHTATSTVTDPGHHHITGSNGFQQGNAGGSVAQLGTTGGSIDSTASTGITVATTNTNTGGGGTHNTVGPGGVCNWIIKT